MCPAGSNKMRFAKVGSCNKYYECINGIAKLFKCPNGLEFISETENCHLSPKTNEKCISCPLVDDPNKIVTFVSENNCNQ